MVKWMLAILDEPMLPTYDIMFVQPVKYTLPWTPEGQAHELNLRLVRCLNKIDGRVRYFAETTGRVVRIGKRGTVALPPFDGPVEGLDEWCRRVLRLIAEEE